MSAHTTSPNTLVQWPLQSSEEQVRSLLLLNEAARTINSILELDVLLDKIVNDVATTFDCSVAGISLKDPVTGNLVAAAVQGRVVRSGKVFRVGLDGITGHVAATGKMHYAADVSKDPYYIACSKDTRSEVGIPLKVGNELIGVFSAQCCEVNAFTDEQLQVLQALAGHIAIGVQNARIFERERAEKNQLYWEQQEAAAIQQALFPKVSPLIPGMEVEGRCMTARAVGGDWFDYIRLADGRWAFVLADVAGKGMPAALLMTSSRGILRAMVETTPEPSVLLKRLNRILCDDFPCDKFVTMLYGVFDPAARRLTFANAGHPYPIYADGEGATVLTTCSGLPLGIADGEYDECTVELKQSSRLLFYSDGITEAQNDAGEQFGVERLQAELANPRVSVDRLFGSVCMFTSCQPAGDDATVILLKTLD